MPETLKIAVDGRGVARLLLARTEKHNAISAPMMDELRRIFDSSSDNGYAEFRYETQVFYGTLD